MGKEGEKSEAGTWHLSPSERSRVLQSCRDPMFPFPLPSFPPPPFPEAIDNAMSPSPRAASVIAAPQITNNVNRQRARGVQTTPSPVFF